jgi:hypothetical protein
VVAAAAAGVPGLHPPSVGKAEKHPPRSLRFPRGSTNGGSNSEQARERHRPSLGGLAELAGTTTCLNCVARKKVSATALQSCHVMRGRDPGDRPDHRGRGQGLSESGLIFDLAGHGICLLSAFHGHRRAKGPTTDLRCRDAAAKLVLAHAVGALGFSLTPARAHARQERACIVS